MVFSAKVTTALKAVRSFVACENIADSLEMSRKAAPKPEELIQKLEEKFDGFKV